MRKAEFCLLRTFIQSCLDETMPVIFQAAAYYFPGNVAHALWRAERGTRSSTGKQCCECESGGLILLCSSFQLQKQKSEGLTTGSTEK